MSPFWIDELGPGDLPDALRLSTEAGWNQTAADWGRLLDLAPGACFAGRLDGALVATATAVDYPGTATWIGMVIVGRAARRQGFGTRLLASALAHGQRASPTVGLDATDLGRPLYLARGFRELAPIDRWQGTLGAAGPPDAGVQVEVAAGGRLPAEALAFDRQACGVDRSALLAHLLAEPGVVAWLARVGGAIRGLAFLRPGHAHFHLGPVVAEDGAIFSSLLDSAGQQLGGRTVLVDTPRDGVAAGRLEPRGLSVQRRLVRMTYGRPQGILVGARVAAATAFEWG